jgi:2-succinyl-6-hydroxy-2,4-cyclohexadiene-1-carboxylate synthase
MEIVALHGFTGSAADWNPLQEALGRPVRTVDFPGHGTRKLLRESAGYSLAAHLNLITETAQGHDRVTLVGYSMGGRLALHWALAHPERLERLILVSASPGLATETERQNRVLGDQALADFLHTKGLEAFYKYWYNQPYFTSLHQLPADQLQPIMTRRMANDPAGLALSLKHVGTGALPSLWERLGELKGRVDLVTGEHDPKFQSIAHRMGERLPKARLSVVEGAGHGLHLEKPQDLAQLIAG